MDLIAINNHYHGRLVERLGATRGGILLPVSAQVPATDLVVLSAGLGRIQPDGTHWPMQAAPGDRVVVQADHYRGQLSPTEWIVKDEDLVAIIPGPAHTRIKPAGAYVLVEPDPLPRVRETESGVLVSAVPLLGGEARERREAERLHAEFVQRHRQRMALIPDPRERIAYTRREVAALPKWQQQLLREAHDNGGATGWQDLQRNTSAVVPCSGVLVSVGPGPVRNGRRVRCDDLPGHTMARVHWDSACTAIELWDEERCLLALPASAITAVEG